MRVGDRVQIRGRGTSFVGWRGVIVAKVALTAELGFKVLLDGDDDGKEIYFGPNSLIVIDESQPLIAGD